MQDQTSQQLRKQAKAYGLNEKLSQNFLVDEPITGQIARACQTYTSEPIYEIGPGSGFLTQHLLKLGQPITVIEIDDRFVGLLKKQFESQIQVIHNNALHVNFEELLSAPKNVIIGNLPYHLTGPLLFHVLGEMENSDYPLRNRLSHAVFMIQKEVGERLLAKPGDTQYSQLTLQLQYWYHIERVCMVPRTAFEPIPKVDSIVVKLTPRTEPQVPVKNLAKLSKLIKLAFLHRRKTALNSLKISGYPEDKLVDIYSQLDIDTKFRPQELSIKHYAFITDMLQSS